MGGSISGGRLRSMAGLARVMARRCVKSNLNPARQTPNGKKANRRVPHRKKRRGTQLIFKPLTSKGSKKPSAGERNRRKRWAKQEKKTLKPSNAKSEKKGKVVRKRRERERKEGESLYTQAGRRLAPSRRVKSASGPT